MMLPNSHSVFSGVPVRALLRIIGYRADDADNEITLGLVFETMSSTLCARERSHLTHSTDQNSQIRFPLRDRVKRSLVKLANDVSRYLPDATTITVDISPDDFVSREFFAVLEDHLRTPLKGDCFKNADELLSATEREVLIQLRNPNQSIERLLEKAQERLYAGDYRCAFNLLIKISPAQRNDQVHYLLGLCTNFFGQTHESEIHFREMLKSQDPLARVKAAYVTSMLYLRMHEKKHQSLAKAEKLLDEAYLTIDSHPDLDDHTFHRVFNRNGFALCLFRRGKVVEALEMLDHGISALNQSGSGAVSLHRSVLIYNAVQCLRALGRYADCEARAYELLEIDPLFPEYHLELARVQIEHGKFSEAVSSIERAERLDPFIPEVFALRGYIEVERDNLGAAADFYGRAVQLDPTNVAYAQDLSYCLAHSSSEGIQDHAI